MVDVKTIKKGTKFVQYLRVSTHKQGKFGNGMESQDRDISLFLSSQNAPEVVGRYVEVDSGANAQRPQLHRALRHCRSTGAHLLASHVDRISRDVEFIAGLVKDPKIQIRVANLPNADTFQIHLFSALAFAEREFISRRTKSAMAVAKARGKKFGNPKIGAMNKIRKNKARKYAATVAPIAIPLREQGMTYQQIANTLNEMELKTASGSGFYPTQVKRIIDRVVA